MTREKPGSVEQRRGDLFDPLCSTRRLLDRVGSKWVAMIVKTLTESGELRYAELKRRTPGISAKVLAQTLRALEADHLLTRRVEPTVPPSVFYSLTPLGISLDVPLGMLRDWAEEHMAEVDGLDLRDSPPRHTDGVPLRSPQDRGERVAASPPAGPARDVGAAREGSAHC